MRWNAKKALLVMPQIPFIADRPEQFRLLSFATLRDLLTAIQDLLLPSSRNADAPPTTLVGFSNGNNILANMIVSNMNAPKGSPDRQAIAGMLDRVVAFDPPGKQGEGNSLINACLAFRKSVRPNLEIRLYTQTWYDPGFASLFKELVQASLPPKQLPFYIRPGDKHSIGYFPRGQSGDVWEKSGQRALDLLAGGRSATRWDSSLRTFDNVHLWFPALFMADAMR
jgi:hypothetical protein